MSTDLGQFWRGRVVYEKDPLWPDNPGHIVGFVRNAELGPRVLIRVDFANGDRYNVEPDELELK